MMYESVFILLLHLSNTISIPDVVLLANAFVESLGEDNMQSSGGWVM